MTVDIPGLQDFLMEKLKDLPSQKSFDYTVFGKEIENYITSALIKYFKNKNMHNYKIAPDKNYFPDFEIPGEIVLEIKAARNNANPENDMGTLNSWDEKLEKFGDSIYYIFIKYECDDSGIVNKINNIYIDKVYNFIGINSAKTLKYREKDGNLRPKSWDDFQNGKNYVKDYNDFISMLKKTDGYRAYRITVKKLKAITNSHPDYLKEIEREFFSKK